MVYQVVSAVISQLNLLMSFSRIQGSSSEEFIQDPDIALVTGYPIAEGEGLEVAFVFKYKLDNDLCAGVNAGTPVRRRRRRETGVVVSSDESAMSQELVELILLEPST